MSFQRVAATLKPAEQIAAFLDWLVAAGVDLFDVALIRFSPDAPAGMFIPGSKNIDRAGLEQSLPWLRFENSRTAGAYFRPARGQAWPLLFLDDVPPSEAQRLAETYSAALIETSPGRYHVWLTTDRALNERERYLAQAALVRQTGADPGSVSGEHWGRLPGFKNRKPGKENWVNLRRLTTNKPFQWALSPESACCMADERLERRTGIKQSAVERDESAAEWKFVRSALEAGISPDVVQRQLLEHCATRRGQDARRYAELTMRKACAKRKLA